MFSKEYNLFKLKYNSQINFINCGKSLILNTIHKLKIIKQVKIILRKDGKLKYFPKIFSKNKTKPFKNPQSIKLRLAPCHNPAADITKIRLKNRICFDFLDPPKGIYK